MRLATCRVPAVESGSSTAITPNELPGFVANRPRPVRRRPLGGGAPSLAAPAGFAVRIPDGVRLAGQPDTRPYHEAALDAWELAGRRGVVVRPAGGDGAAIARGAIGRTRVPTLCLVPTVARLDHWLTEARRAHAGPLGCVDEEGCVLAPLTVATFAGAARHAAALERRFGLVVVDDAHLVERAVPAPTLERIGADAWLGLTGVLPWSARGAVEALLGRTVGEITIARDAGGAIGGFDLVTLSLGLDPDELLGWARERARWRGTTVAFSARVPPPAWTRAAGVALRRLLARHRAGAVVIVAATDRAAAAVRARLRVEAGVPVVPPCALEPGGRWGGMESIVLAGLQRGAPALARRAGALLRPAPGRRGVVYALVSRPTATYGCTCGAHSHIPHAPS